MTIAEMKARHSELLKETKDFLAKCEKDHNGLTADEKSHFDELHGTAEKLKSQIEHDEAPANPELIKALKQGSGWALEQNRPQQAKTDYPKFRDGNGQEIVARASGQNFSDKPLDGELGHAIHNLLRGDIQNVQVGSTDSSGGYLLTPELSTRFIDLARSASVCMRAGAITIPMSTSDMVIAGLSADATSYWRPETAAVTSSDTTFKSIILKAKTLACIVPVSIEILEDSANAGSIIEAALRAAMAQKLDQAALIGTGAASEPKGIRNHADINTIASVGTPADYSDISLAVGDVYAGNYPGQVEGLAWINHPRTDDTYDGLQDTTNQPMLPTPRVAKLQRYSTTALPTDEGSSESVSIVGDFTQLAFGMRTSGVNVRILDSGTVNDGTNDWNATSQLLRHIVCYMRADVAVLRPGFFTALTGITA